MTLNTGPHYGTCSGEPEKALRIYKQVLALIHPLSTSRDVGA